LQLFSTTPYEAGGSQELAKKKRQHSLTNQSGGRKQGQKKKKNSPHLGRGKKTNKSKRGHLDHAANNFTAVFGVRRMFCRAFFALVAGGPKYQPLPPPRGKTRLLCKKTSGLVSPAGAGGPNFKKKMGNGTVFHGGGGEPNLGGGPRTGGGGFNLGHPANGGGGGGGRHQGGGGNSCHGQKRTGHLSRVNQPRGPGGAFRRRGFWPGAKRVLNRPVPIIARAD